MVAFRKIWRAFFSFFGKFSVSRFALLPYYRPIVLYSSLFLTILPENGQIFKYGAKSFNMN